MLAESIQSGELGDAEATIATNLLGLIRLNAALLPLLQKQAHAAVMTVSSGLAFGPRADHLTGQRQINDPNAMPLKDFIAEVMNILTASPDRRGDLRRARQAAAFCREKRKLRRFLHAVQRQGGGGGALGKIRATTCESKSD